MDLTAEEILMYRVMKAIYDSGIPIDFKGAMVLKACLLEAGYPSEIRHTVDIDANWYSETAPTAGQMVESIKDALRKSGLDFDVRLYRMYGVGRSAGFELCSPDTGETLFSMDIDVNKPIQPAKIYQIKGISFRGITPSQIIADKVSAISTDAVFRRIKDVVDLYYLSQVFAPDASGITASLQNSGRTLGDFSGFMNGMPELEHAYEKFRYSGNVNKPPFAEVYDSVKAFLSDLLPQ